MGEHAGSGWSIRNDDAGRRGKSMEHGEVVYATTDGVWTRHGPGAQVGIDEPEGRSGRRPPSTSGKLRDESPPSHHRSARHPPESILRPSLASPTSSSATRVQALVMDPAQSSVQRDHATIEKMRGPHSSSVGHPAASSWAAGQRNRTTRTALEDPPEHRMTQDRLTIAMIRCLSLRILPKWPPQHRAFVDKPRVVLPL